MGCIYDRNYLFLLDHNYHIQVAYQSVLGLNYADKFLTAIALEFRDKYKNDLESQNFLNDFSDFHPIVDQIFMSVKKEFIERPKK